MEILQQLLIDCCLPDLDCTTEGGFRNVYKGEKRLDSAFRQENREFWKEIIMFSRHKHESLVGFLGFCDENDNKIFVYEYTYKRSLDLHLNSNDLTCGCFRICFGMACGLDYLHNLVVTQNKSIP